MEQQRTIKTVKTSSQHQAFYFCLIGAIAAAVHFCCLWIIVQYIGISPAWGNVWAFVFAFIASFCGHYSLTFKHQAQYWLNSLWRWLLSSAAGFLLNQTLFIACLFLLGEQYYLICWLLVTILVTCITFSLGKFWAFK